MLLMQNVPIQKEYITLFLINNGAWILCAYITALYIGKQNSTDNFFKRSVVSFFLFSGISLFSIFLYNFGFSRLFVVLVFIGFGTTIIISRTLYVGAAYYLRKQYPLNKKVIVIGYNELSKRLVENFDRYYKSISVAGFFEDEEYISGNGSLPMLGRINDSVQYAIENNISEIYSTVSPERNFYIYELAQLAETNFIRFKFVPDFRMFINRKVHIDFARNIPILSLRTEPLENVDSQLKKRSFDIIFSVFIIFFMLSWLVPLIALLIKLESRGPVFFTQLRSGKNNNPFLCYKFRSLKVNHEAHNKQVTRDDDRFTRIGRFLRKSNIDELPQFFNVFRGEMSVVGPRPHMLKHTEEYSQTLNHYMIRHFVKPGVTGWAQINGYRGEIKKKKDLRGRIEHDIWYMENWTMWLDLRIIVLTVYKSIRGDKNAF
ncbi:MAG: Undecaprenyl-phosphate glucose phosphotransferase [Segetibacter sp.]|jgi:putative colanic acid biosynthesis UDP-glucose lipid carrier transferase|nr:Undecaprenyl-phosphate glucose phosphotransferase [Segetibacter sp.]